MYVLATPIFLEEHPACVGVGFRVWAPECFVVVDIVPTICMNQLEHIAVQLRKRMSPWIPRASCKFEKHIASVGAFIVEVEPPPPCAEFAAEGDALETAFGANLFLVEDDWSRTQHLASIFFIGEILP